MAIEEMTLQQATMRGYVLGPQEVALLLAGMGKTAKAVSKRTVIHWTHRGLLPGVRVMGDGVGGRYGQLRYRKADLEGFEPPTEGGRTGPPRKEN